MDPQQPPIMPGQNGMPPDPSQDPSMGGIPDPSQADPSQGPSMPEPNPNPVGDGTPYFMGDHALIRFSGGEEGYGPDTYWLVDKSNHTIRPFESHMALDAAFGADLQQALSNIVTVTPPVIDGQGNITDGVLHDFTILGPEYVIKDDGTSKPLHFSPHQLKSRYGKPIDESTEELATEVLDGFLGLLKTNEHKTNVPSAFIASMLKDHQLMAFYISALAYGEYTLQDIYTDVVRRYHESKN